MSHEMYSTDTAMYAKTKAWHGLGTVVEDYPNVKEALKLSGLDWEVLQSDYLYAEVEGDTYIADGYVANIRSDTNEVLGVVSKDYQPVQNRELFDIAEAAAGQHCKVETAGSLKGGRNVYLLLKADSFAVGEDEIQPYFGLFDGKDGSMSTCGLNTGVRVVCSNTMEYAMSGAIHKVTLRHRGNTIDDVYDQMCDAITNFKETGKIFREKVDHIATYAHWNEDRIQKFFKECYVNIIDPSIKKEKDEVKKEKYSIKMGTSIMKMQAKMQAELELNLNVSTGWLAANAVTNYIQKKQGERGRKTSTESRIQSNLIGAGATQSSKVMRTALNWSSISDSLPAN